MIADAFHDGGGAAVTDREAFAGPAPNVEAAAGRAIEHGIAANGVGGGIKLGDGRRDEDDLAAAHALADIVVALPGELDADAPDEERAEALARAAAEVEFERAVGQPFVAVAVGDLAGELRADTAVGVADLVFEAGLAPGLEAALGILQDDLVERPVLELVVALPGVEPGAGVVEFRHGQEAGEIEQVGLGMVGYLALLEVIGAPDDLVEGARPDAGEILANLLGHGVEEEDDVFRRALVLGAKGLVLTGDTDGAGVEMALADVDAAGGDERRRAEVEFLRAHHGGHEDIEAGLHAAVGAQSHAIAEAVEEQDLVRLGEAEFPRAARILNGGERRGAGAAVVPGNQDDVGIGFGHARGDGAHAGLGDELDADLGAGVDLLEVIDELREILDAVNIVVRRRRNQRHARRAAAKLGDDGADLVAGNLAALAGLGALRHLDLDLGGAGQVLGGDAEAARGDLLDAAVLGVAVFHRREAGAVLAALAGIGFAADAVHGDGERLVRLGRESAERHAGGGEAAADLLHRLDFLQRNGRTLFQAETLTQGDRRGGFHGGDILLVVLPLAGLVGALDADVGVEALDERRSVGVKFAVAAVTVKALVGQLGALRESAAVAGERLLRDVAEAEALDLGGRAGEGVIDDLGIEPDGMESLRTAVARERGDAHLGHDLEQAFFHGGPIILRGGGRLGDLEGVDLQLAAREQILDGGEGGVRIDRGGAVGEQAGQLVDFAALGRFTDEARLGAALHADEVMMHRADGQQHGHRSVRGIDLPVAQDEDGSTRVDGVLGLPANAVEMLFQAIRSLGDGKTAREGGGTERPVFLPEDLLDFRVGEDGRLETQQLGVPGRLVEPVVARAGQHLDRHDQLFADRVDRRIGHLREELLEIGIKGARFPGQDGERGVLAHGADRFLAGDRHGLEKRGDHVHLLLGITGTELLLEQGRAGRGLPVEGGSRHDVADVVAQPLAVGLLLRVGRLDLVVAEQLAVDGVDSDHLAGAEPAFLDDLAVVELQDADLRAEGEEAVLGDFVARGAQAVAIKRRADGPPIAENQRGGAVPGLVEGLVIFVEFLYLGRRLGIALPGGGDEHEHGMEKIAAAHDEQFQRIVEGRGIAAAGLDDGA